MFTSNQSREWKVIFNGFTALVVFQTPMSESIVAQHANDAIAYRGDNIAQKMQKFYSTWSAQRVQVIPL